MLINLPETNFGMPAKLTLVNRSYAGGIPKSRELHTPVGYAGILPVL